MLFDVVQNFYLQEANVILSNGFKYSVDLEPLNELFEVALPLHSSNIDLDFNSEVSIYQMIYLQ